MDETGNEKVTQDDRIVIEVEEPVRGKTFVNHKNSNTT